MNISALTNRINFSSNMPIYHVYSENESGQRTRLTNVSGVVEALVKRLNRPSSDEAKFMKSQGNYMSDYKENAVTTSTYRGRDTNRNYFIVYGDDANKIYQLRQDCYRRKKIDVEELYGRIFGEIISPKKNKVYTTDTQEEVGLVLYTIPKGSKYNQLRGFDITTKSGRVIAEFPPKETPKKTGKLEQPELFDTSAFITEEDYVERRANLPSFPIHSKRRIRG